MNTWFTEYQTEDVTIGLRITKVLRHEQTAFQELAVVESEAYGRVLVLDGAIQTTSRDEFVYHEMITHVPLAMHPHPRKVAVIGGGDGGTIREILKHPEVEEAHLIEIDEGVVQASKEFFPEISCGLDSPRAFVHFTDGIAWVKNARDFDVIIVDSTDPVGPAQGLFTPEFYHSIYEALGEDGIMVAQSESPLLEPEIIQTVMTGVKQSFVDTRLYLAAVATYPTGLWSFTLGSKKPIGNTLRSNLSDFPTKYWSRAMQDACFVLPPFVQEILP